MKGVGGATQVKLQAASIFGKVAARCEMPGA